MIQINRFFKDGGQQRIYDNEYGEYIIEITFFGERHFEARKITCDMAITYYRCEALSNTFT